MSDYIVYIVKCNDHTLYTGITTDLDRRVREHNGDLSGGARYTKHRSPVKVVYHETLSSRSEACKREWDLKQLRRSEKLLLIASQ